MATVNSIENSPALKIEKTDDPLLAYVLCTKLSENLYNARMGTVKEQLESKAPAPSEDIKQETFSQLAFEASKRSHEALKTMQREYDNHQKSLRKPRLSVDFDAPNDVASPLEAVGQSGNNEFSDETIELRKRLLGGRSEQENTNETPRSVDRQIEDQDNLQSSLLEDMTSLVGTLRQSASAFQNALEEDKNVLNAAEIGVQIASKSLTDIGGKLKKYDKKKLGYLFYITVFLFMIVGLLITFLIIKLFPAL